MGMTLHAREVMKRLRLYPIGYDRSLFNSYVQLKVTISIQRNFCSILRVDCFIEVIGWNLYVRC